MANIAWNIASIDSEFAKAEQFDERLFAILAQAVKRQVDGSGAQDIASTARNFAKAEQLGVQLYATLAQAGSGR